MSFFADLYLVISNPEAWKCNRKYDKELDKELIKDMVNPYWSNCGKPRWRANAHTIVELDKLLN